MAKDRDIVRSTKSDMDKRTEGQKDSRLARRGINAADNFVQPRMLISSIRRDKEKIDKYKEVVMAGTEFLEAVNDLELVADDLADVERQKTARRQARRQNEELGWKEKQFAIEQVDHERELLAMKRASFAGNPIPADESSSAAAYREQESGFRAQQEHNCRMAEERIRTKRAEDEILEHGTLRLKREFADGKIKSRDELERKIDDLKQAILEEGT